MKLPLVRTEGKIFENQLQVTVETLLDPTAQLQVECRSARAIAAEQGLNLGDCLYFYVGYACSDFVEMALNRVIRTAFVLLYDNSIVTHTDTGGHTPFDSGGVWHGYIRFSPEMTTEQARTWAAACPSVNTLANWRDNVDEYVSRAFGTEGDYVEATHPRVSDTEGDGRMTHPRNDRRAWTYEVRLHRDHPLHDGLRAIVANAESVEAILQALENSDGSMAESLRLALRQGDTLPTGATDQQFANRVTSAIVRGL